MRFLRNFKWCKNQLWVLWLHCQPVGLAYVLLWISHYSRFSQRSRPFCLSVLCPVFILFQLSQSLPPYAMLCYATRLIFFVLCFAVFASEWRRLSRPLLFFITLWKPALASRNSMRDALNEISIMQQILSGASPRLDSTQISSPSFPPPALIVSLPPHWSLCYFLHCSFYWASMQLASRQILFFAFLFSF